MVWAEAQAVYGNRNWVPQRLSGTGPGYLATRDWEDLDEGVCFTDEDVRACNAVCLIGATVKQQLFDDESPIGKMIRLRNVRFRVIGLLSRRGANMMGQDQDDCIFAPWTTIKFRVNSGRGIDVGRGGRCRGDGQYLEQPVCRGRAALSAGIGLAVGRHAASGGGS